MVWFRKREDLAVLGVGFGISRATAYCYRDEAVAVLAAQAPELTEALYQVRAEAGTHVILDGKIVDTDRCRAKTTSRKGEQIDLRYSGKKHEHALGALYKAAAGGLPTLADPATREPVSAFTPVKQPTDGRRLDVDNRTYNALLRSLTPQARAGPSADANAAGATVVRTADITES